MGAYEVCWSELTCPTDFRDSSQPKGAFCADKLQQETSMRKALLGLIAAATLFGGLATAAEAKVIIYFGSPYYSYRPGPDYLFYPNRGWYRAHHRNQLSCFAARRAVQNHGYRQVSVRECQGRVYTFAATRNGHRILVYVNSRTGAVWHG
jgi:hypothetical protein